MSTDYSCFKANEETWYLENLATKIETNLNGSHSNIIGRHQNTCHIVLADRRVSRRHCKIELVQDRYILSDIVRAFCLFQIVRFS